MYDASRHRVAWLAVCLAAWLAPPVFAQQEAEPQAEKPAAEKPSFQEAVAQAKQTSQPLVVFGMTDT